MHTDLGMSAALEPMLQHGVYGATVTVLATKGKVMQPDLPFSQRESASDQAHNPLEHDEIARQYSAYHGPAGRGLKKLRPSETNADGPIVWVHEMLRSTILNQGYPCTGARSAFHRHDYRLGFYPPVTTEAASRGLAFDLYEFTREYSRQAKHFYSFVAAFDGPVASTELAFEGLLWSQLQQLHDIDAGFFGWDPSVASDPEDSRFCFSFGGKAYFVIGMHAAASRLARRFAWPVLVFNAHEMFDRVREHGTFEKFQSTVRIRDRELQGCVNPVVQKFGTVSEARQYSGRHVGDDWSCPFQPRGARQP